MSEAIVWTIVFFGLDLLALVGLIWFAMSRDRRKAQQDT